MREDTSKPGTREAIIRVSQSGDKVNVPSVVVRYYSHSGPGVGMTPLVHLQVKSVQTRDPEVFTNKSISSISGADIAQPHSDRMIFSPAQNSQMLQCVPCRRFLSEVGTVSAEQQRRQLFGEESGDNPPSAASTPSAAASDKDGGAIVGGKKQQ